MIDKTQPFYMHRRKYQTLLILGGCIVTGGFHQSSLNTKLQIDDHCASCTCFNESSICHKKTCPVLDCALEFQQPPKHKECCPSCPLVAEVRSTCTFNGETFPVKFFFNDNLYLEIINQINKFFRRITKHGILIHVVHVNVEMEKLDVRKHNVKQYDVDRVKLK